MAMNMELYEFDRSERTDYAVFVRGMMDTLTGGILGKNPMMSAMLNAVPKPNDNQSKQIIEMLRDYLVELESVLWENDEADKRVLA